MSFDYSYVSLAFKGRTSAIIEAVCANFFFGKKIKNSEPKIENIGSNNVKPLASKAGDIAMRTVSDELNEHVNGNQNSDIDRKNYLDPDQARNRQNMDVEDIEKIKGKLGEEFGK